MNVRLPSGTRDLLSNETAWRRRIQEKMMNVFFSSGFEEVMTPAIEYYQTYAQAFSQLEEKQMYKFFDENGEILMLRMDMTVPIARLASSRLKDAPAPLRLCYSAPIWKVRRALAGKRSEITDCGIELIGGGKSDAFETVLLALDTIDAVVDQKWILELGDTRFFELAAKKVFSTTEEIEKLADLIDRKSLVELEQFLNEKDLDDQTRDFFMELPLMAGDITMLNEVMERLTDPQLMQVLEELRELWEALSAMGSAEHIRFDLGKLPHLNYYTGLIFEGFMDGAGTAILSGGRYDHLMETFGNPSRAIGFSIKLDVLTELIAKPMIDTITVVEYPFDQSILAAQKAEELRQDGPVILRENNEIASLIIRKEIRG